MSAQGRTPSASGRIAALTGIVAALVVFVLGIMVGTIDALSWRVADLECELVRHQDAHARRLEHARER